MAPPPRRRRGGPGEAERSRRGALTLDRHQALEEALREVGREDPDVERTLRAGGLGEARNRLAAASRSRRAEARRRLQGRQALVWSHPIQVAEPGTGIFLLASLDGEIAAWRLFRLGDRQAKVRFLQAALPPGKVAIGVAGHFDIPADLGLSDLSRAEAEAWIEVFVAHSNLVEWQFADDFPASLDRSARQLPEAVAMALCFAEEDAKRPRGAPPPPTPPLGARRPPLAAVLPLGPRRGRGRR